MQLIAVLIAAYNPVEKKVIILTRYYELNSVGIFYRNTVKDSMKFVCRESVIGLDKGTRHSVMHEDKYCHIQMGYGSDKVGAYAFCDQDYPKRIAFAFLNAVLQAFQKKVGDDWKKYKEDESIEVPEIKQLFQEYQDPKNVDKVLLAQTKVDETNIILHENIKKLLERQGDLDQLVAKSNDLSAGAKMFYKQSKDMNKKSCCEIF
ncbi:unnamed protein product (macronuclear) [Paramecium tetraurelia]|uniref:Chromosome undetermined scaffold_31, whole genome shotgun sequence n=1 Tax=Paramecium tetraurelia TaxID=5888 RepID=Q3SEQ4_PARTE|nr:uncharacterized protein GSPATT00011479001 [Paramecium tetraurelia]CAH69608.1 synaptobrevin 6-1 [Paramecium tetraurelia]CAK75878.1 unnamed protein product [Paramecium tetraurelia]|eukprot:XP_001443275.1 hypothetical protein (macronuclear) [Paramecium tetraurelia strain d4-2]